MYYKWLANHATYDFEHGGDLSFDAHLGQNVHLVASGDAEGNPRKQTGRIENEPGTFPFLKTRMESQLYVHLEHNRGGTMPSEAIRSKNIINI